MLERVSVDSAGVQGNEWSQAPAISGVNADAQLAVVTSTVTPQKPTAGLATGEGLRE
jgi:hypothetical protein